MDLNLFIAKKIGGNSAIACFSIAISITIMFVAIAISDGFKREIGQKAVGFSGEIVLTAPGQDITNDLYPIESALSYISDIKSIEQVKSVSGVAYKPGMAKTDESVHGLLFKGVDSTYSLDFFAQHLVSGALPDFSEKGYSNQILISQRLSEMLGYKVGDKLLAYFIDDNVRVRRFEICGLYSIQLENMDQRLALIDIRHIRKLNGWGDTQSSCVEIALGGDGTSVNNARRNEVASIIDNIVAQKSSDEDTPVVVKQISDVYGHLFDWLSLLDLNVLVVLILMVVVASFNMISGLLIILFKKISMIGLLKALGMRTKEICKVFIYRGGLIVLKGMAIGNICAMVICLVQKYFKVITLDPNNYFVNYIPIQISITTIILLNVAAFILMMLVLIVPVMFISKVSPDRTIKVN